MNWKSMKRPLASMIPMAITGSVLETVGMTIRVGGFPVPVGAIAQIERPTGDPILAEVVGFCDCTAILYPYHSMTGIRRGNPVRLKNTMPWMKIGNEVLGKVLDAHGNSLSETIVSSLSTERIPFHQSAPKAHERPRITQSFSTGIRAIDGLLTLGQGQRVGIFAGSGVGKSVLLGMIARYTTADVIVIGLVGERGREVNDFIERDLGERGLSRSVLVVATSDESALMRVRAAQTTTAVAEYFRDQGKNVLLLMDSLTRFAMAQREIGLAAGEPPTRNGYPPSVFAMLPTLVERTGRTRLGNITAMYTVLVEGDDENEPIADTTRGLLDGHIWLSRKLASQGHYPPIDIPASISRLMPDICDREHVEMALRMKKLIATWREHEDLITIGAYRKGTHAELDTAVAKRDAILRFLRQNIHEASCLEDARHEIREILTND
ncbi:MAG: FliI/YscN family ATPase [Planctomycetia bacterium]|nr:FliI/YscN family ATPase [Planctomycetia bacterium]